MLPITKVHFDLTSVLTTLAQNAVIMETKGLTRCLLSETTTKSGQKELVLNTEGINMHELMKHSDVRRSQLSPGWCLCGFFYIHMNIQSHLLAENVFNKLSYDSKWCVSVCVCLCTYFSCYVCPGFGCKQDLLK